MKGTASLLLLSTLAAAGPAASQTAQLVADVQPGPPVPVLAGGPRHYAAALGRVVFFSPHPDGQNETLWSTDGTDAGTHPLLAVGPGESPASFPPPAAVVASFAGRVFFVATTPGTFDRRSVFRTDGTRGGTFALSPPLFSLRLVRQAGEALYWSGCDDDGCGLWRSDGTVTGTRRVFAGEAISAERLANKTYFVALPPKSGLYQTDGTAEGTSRVKGLPAGFGDALTPAQGRLYFAAGDLGSELWVSDGSRRGTFLLRRFFEDDCRFCSRNTVFLGTVGAVLYFFADGADGFGVQLWTSDGTPAGTRRLTAFSHADRVRAKAAIGDARNVVGLAAGKVLLALSGTAGPRLWTTRGSVASTLPLTGCPRGCPAVLSSLFPLGRRVLFVGEHPSTGAEIWSTDGTGPGTRVLFDLCGGRCSSNPQALTVVGGTLFFNAEQNGLPSLFSSDGAVTRHLGPVPSADQRIDLALLGSNIVFTGFDERYGRQPWVSDGTFAGARMITALGAGAAGSSPRQLAALGERVLFSADDGTGRRLFASDGTAGATLPLTSGPDPGPLTVAGGTGFFSVDLPNLAGAELWASDGSPGGTKAVATFPDRALSHLTELSGRLVFLVSSTLGERPLHAFFASDGTAAGTVELFDLPDDTVSVADVAGLGGEIYFVARGETGIRLLRSDGTAAGTRPIYELPCDCTSPISPLSYARVGPHVYFTALAEEAFGFGTALFRTDGTAAGTVPVIPPFAGPPQGVFEPSALFSFAGDLYFFARSPELAADARLGLFRGTGLDAIQLSSAGSEPGRQAAPHYAPAGGTLLFRAWDPEHGFELWKTDGTPAGTQRVADIAPGPLSSDPRGLVSAGGRVFFSANDELHGRELWTSDGSEVGTRLVQDLAPGPLSSAPEGMTQLGNQLFFAADDGHVGREPWRLELAPTPGGSSGVR